MIMDDLLKGNIDWEKVGILEGLPNNLSKEQMIKYFDETAHILQNVYLTEKYFDEMLILSLPLVRKLYVHTLSDELNISHVLKSFYEYFLEHLEDALEYDYQPQFLENFTQKYIPYV
jgi:hypothetical protein